MNFLCFIRSLSLLSLSPHVSHHLCLQNSPSPLSKLSDHYKLSSPLFFHCVLCFIIVLFTVSHVHYTMTAQRILTLVYLYACSKPQDHASPVTDAQKSVDILVSLFLQVPYLYNRSTITLLPTYMEVVKTHEVISAQYLILSFLMDLQPYIGATLDPPWQLC